MKKIIFVYAFIFLLAITGNNILNAQSVAINTDGTTPNSSAILDIKSITKGLLIPRMTSLQRTAISSPANGLMVFDITTNSLWFYNGTAWNVLSAGSSTNYWSLSGSDIYNNTSGNVGIGTTTPANKLTVQTLTNSYGIAHTDGTITVGTYIGLGDGWLGTKSNHPLAFFTNNSLQQMVIATNGNVGIGTTTPATKLTIHTPNNTDGFSHESDGGIILKDVVGGVSATFGTYSNHVFRLIANSTAVINIEPTGNVGVGVTGAVNKLQIGSMGAAGFNGNDLALGNGTNATGIFQSNANLQVYSSTNIALMPQSGAGRVGINTTTPRAPLDIVGKNNITALAIQYSYMNDVTYNNGIGHVSTDGGASIPDISIMSSGRIYATEFDAYSDARIKNIIGISNSTRDLEIIKHLQISDYTLKDNFQHGNKTYKKVIAQQVEKVYPQVVSKHTDFIPNVYQLTSKIEKVTNGYLLYFAGKHHIGIDAKKLQLVLPGKDGMQQFNIVAIPDDKEVIIEAADLNADKIFVYGEEVDDFRTVDYEGLTTLNISATQELSKLLQKQQTMIKTLQQQIDLLTKRLEDLEKKIK